MPANWPTAPDRYAGPWTARTSAPVLVVGNHYDPITYYAWAHATARLLPNSRLLSYAGSGHLAYPRSDCIRAHVNRYLLTGALPQRVRGANRSDVQCEPVPPPDATPAPAAAARKSLAPATVSPLRRQIMDAAQQ